MKFILSFIPVAVLMPTLAFAQDWGNVNNFFTGFYDLINNILVPLVFALAFLVFLWGLFLYFILGGGDEGKREQGKSLMLWGIIAFVVMVALWGIVEIITTLLGITGNETVDLPSLPGIGS